MQAKTYIPILVLSLELAACGKGRSSDVRQSTIEQSYEITFNEASGRLKAFASFHYESTLGTSLELTDGSSISFNGQPMHYDNLFNRANYQLELQLNTRARQFHEFYYINNEGLGLITQARIPPATPIIMPKNSERVLADRELVVLMQGASLQENEEITLCLSYDAAASSTALPDIVECLHSEHAMTLVFSREQLERFPLGHPLRLELKRTSHPDQNNRRIHLTENWQSRPVFITLD